MTTIERKISRRRLLDATECRPIIPVNKKLNFELDDEDEGLQLQDLNQFDLELESINNLSIDFQDDDKFSPCRTRSGVVYESGLKRRKELDSSSEKSRRKKRTFRLRHTSSAKSETGSMADCSENDSGDDRMSDLAEMDESEKRLSLPPPLNYMKNPVSRIHLLERSRPTRLDMDMPSSPLSSCIAEEHLLSPVKTHEWSQPRSLLLSSPIQSPSPPSNTLKALRLGDLLASPTSSPSRFTPSLPHPLTSPCSAPRTLPLKSRLIFADEKEPRRNSYHGPTNVRRDSVECDSTSTAEKAKLANINPFTPSALLAANKRRRNESANDKSFSPRTDRELQKSLDSMSEPGSDDEREGRFSPLPNKRVRVSDINITRYQEEFLELAEIASGQFGVVKKARHRLDGIVYAIKVSKKAVRVNSSDEQVAMNEVFAHAALMKHKNVVRYFNAWVEKGKVYIQNEFCEGGSLKAIIEEHKVSGQKLPEVDLKRMMVQVAKGLHYIHSNQLVHLDIKPENILLSVEHTPTPSPHRMFEQEFEDSGAASGDLSPRMPKVELSSGESSPGESDKITYKIADLGHVVPVEGGDFSPEEGDCRYMAPELLEMEVERSPKLTKADIFSLGLTMYEAASLQRPPKNSSDMENGHEYGNIRKGKLRYLKDYSKEFNAMLAKMVHPDPNQRPTAARLLANCELNPGMYKSKYQLNKELKEAKQKLLMLEAQLNSANQSAKRVMKRKMVGRGAARADSFML